MAIIMEEQTMKNIRSMARFLYWIERFTMFILLFFYENSWGFHSATAFLLLTCFKYSQLELARICDCPDPDGTEGAREDPLFYIERLGIFGLAWSYMPYRFQFFPYQRTLAVNIFVLSNWARVTTFFVSMADKFLLSKPKEFDEIEEAVTNEQLKLENYEDELKESMERSGSVDVVADSEEWEVIQTENLESMENYREEVRSEIEVDLIGEKISCHEEEEEEEERKKEVEYAIDAELMSDRSEDSWEDVRKDDEEKNAIEEEGDVGESEKLLETISAESWVEVDEEKDAIDEECNAGEVDKLSETITAEEKDAIHEECDADEAEKLSETINGGARGDVDEKKGAIHQEVDAGKAVMLSQTIGSMLMATYSIWKLKEHNKDLSAKLEAAYDAIDFYRCIEDIYVEERNKWIDEKELLTESLKKATIEADKLSETITAKSSEHAQKNDDKLSETITALRELEEKNQNLSAKLEEANESLECYRGIEENYIEERNQWIGERELWTVNLEAARETIDELLTKVNDNPENHRSNLDAETEELKAKLDTANSLSANYAVVCGELSAQLSAAKALAELHLICRDEAEERCLLLTEDNAQLFGRLSKAEALVDFYRDQMHNFAH